MTESAVTQVNRRYQASIRGRYFSNLAECVEVYKRLLDAQRHTPHPAIDPESDTYNCFNATKHLLGGVDCALEPELYVLWKKNGRRKYVTHTAVLVSHGGRGYFFDNYRYFSKPLLVRPHATNLAKNGDRYEVVSARSGSRIKILLTCARSGKTGYLNYKRLVQYSFDALHHEYFRHKNAFVGASRMWRGGSSYCLLDWRWSRWKSRLGGCENTTPFNCLDQIRQRIEKEFGHETYSLLQQFEKYRDLAGHLLL